MIEMKKLIIVIHILLTVLLVGCATKGNYVGELKDGKPHGKGTYIWKNGTKYEGEWKDGELHGQGTLTWSSGEKYVGEFKNDKEWNTTEYDKNGNIIGKFVNGEYIEQ